MSEMGSDIAVLHEERLRLIETIPGGVGELLLTEEGPIIQQATDKFYEVIGHTREQMEDIGNNLCRAFYEPDLQVAMNQLQKLMSEEETTCACVFRVRFPDGGLHWISFRGTVFTDAKGRCVTVIIFNNDMIMRQKQEAEIARAKLELALTATGHAVFEYDVATKKIYSHKGLESFGILEGKVLEVTQDLVGNLFFHPDDVCKMQAANEKILAGELHASH